MRVHPLTMRCPRSIDIVCRMRLKRGEGGEAASGRDWSSSEWLWIGECGEGRDSWPLVTRVRRALAGWASLATPSRVEAQCAQARRLAGVWSARPASPLPCPPLESPFRRASSASSPPCSLRCVCMCASSSVWCSLASCVAAPRILLPQLPLRGINCMTNWPAHCSAHPRRWRADRPLIRGQLPARDNEALV